MNNATVLLARCGPLTDSVRLALRFLFWTMAMIPVILYILSVILLVVLTEGKVPPPAPMPRFGWVSIGWQYMAFRLLLRESAATPSLALRQRRDARRVNPAGPLSARRVWGAAGVMVLYKNWENPSSPLGTVNGDRGVFDSGSQREVRAAVSNPQPLLPSRP